MTAILPDAIAPQRFHIPADLDYLAPLRERFMESVGRSLPDKAASEWQLVFSELVTNAIIHGADSDAEKRVSVEWWFDGPAVHLAVTDPGNGPPPEKFENPQLPDDPLAESGRGFFLIDAACDEFRGYRTPDGFRIEASRAYPELGHLLAVDPEMELTLEELSSCYESLSIFGRLAENLQQVDQLGRFIEDAFAGFLNLHPNSRVTLIGSDDAPQDILDSLAGWKWFVSPQDEDSPLASLGNQRAERIHEQHEDCRIPNAYLLPITAADLHFGTLAVHRDPEAPASHSKPLGTLRTLADLCAIACANHHLTTRREQSKLQLREFELAVGIQKSILPILAPPRIPGARASIHQSSSLSVAGDYAEARLDPDGSLVVAIIDVMGKGVAAALLASMFRTAFDLTLPVRPAAELLETLNRSLCRQLNGLTMFLTCAVVRISPDGRTIDHASAGHCPTLIFHPDGSRTQLEASGPPVGLFPDTIYESDTLHPKGGERLVLLTDGTYEWDRPQGDPPDGGWTRLIDFLASHRTTDPDTLWRNLLSQIHATSGPHLEDDCTLITLDIQP